MYNLKHMLNLDMILNNFKIATMISHDFVVVS